MVNLEKRIQMLEKSTPTSVFWFIDVVKAVKPTDFRGYIASWPDKDEVFIGLDKQAVQEQVGSIGRARGLSRVVMVRI